MKTKTLQGDAPICVLSLANVDEKRFLGRSREFVQSMIDAYGKNGSLALTWTHLFYWANTNHIETKNCLSLLQEAGIVPGFDFSEVDFSHLQLRLSSLNGSFERCIFSNTDLWGVAARNSDFSGSEFISANLENSRFSGSKMERVLVSDCLAKGSILAKSNWHESRILKSDFRNADCRFANFSFSKVYESDFSFSDMRKTNFSHALFREINLKHADASGASFREAEFCASDLELATLSECDLSGAKLIDSYLYRVDLFNSKLIGCDLRGTNFLGANLFCADLTDSVRLDSDHSIEGWNLRQGRLKATERKLIELNGGRP